MAIDLTMHSFFEYVGELKGMLVQAQQMLKDNDEKIKSLEAKLVRVETVGEDTSTPEKGGS